MIRRMTSLQLTDSASGEGPEGSSAMGARQVSTAALVPLAGIVWWAVGYFPWLASWMATLFTLSGRAGGGGPRGERLALPLAVSSMWLLVLGAL